MQTFMLSYYYINAAWGLCIIFIVSTFRPELVQVANQCYGISHQNKVSRFHHMSKKDALSFIANLMTEEEQTGEVRLT